MRGPRGRIRAFGIATASVVAIATPARAQQAPRLPPLPPPEAPASSATDLPPLPPPATEPDRTDAAGSPAVTWETPEPNAAEESDEPVDAPPKPARTWYGWQTLLLDGASFVTLLTAGQRSSVVADLSVAAYFLGAPIVHFAHGSAPKGFGSLGLRVGIPLGSTVLGLVIGSAFASGQSSSCGDVFCSPSFEGAALGLVAGIIAAPIVDAAVLAYDEEPVDEPHARPTGSRFHVTPVAALPRDAAGRSAPALGLAGGF